MRSQTLFIAALAPLVAACGPQPYLQVWEWEDAACDDAPCWGRVLVVGREVTYERDAAQPNTGTLTDVGVEELELGLAGLCGGVDDPVGDRVVNVLLDCEGESTWQSYDKDEPPARVEELDALMADVVMALQNCRPRETAMPDHGCDRM